MVKLGTLNSRMKDYYDVWFLSRQFDFDGKTLADAIAKTFSTRRTELSLEPFTSAANFGKNKTETMQWKGLIRRNRLINVPEELKEVMTHLSHFLEPVIQSLLQGNRFIGMWKAPGPWRY